jgi:hypothetical protein
MNLSFRSGGREWHHCLPFLKLALVLARLDEGARFIVIQSFVLFFSKILYRIGNKKEENENKSKFDVAEAVHAKVDAVTYRRYLHDRDALC